MKASLKKDIKKKSIELGFQSEMPTANIFVYELPFGNKSELWLDLSINEPNISIWSNDTGKYIEIRNIESPEDLENFFNGICPEKFRLPFS